MYTSQSGPTFATNQGRIRTLVDVRAVSLLTRLLALLLLAIGRCFALPCGLLGSLGGFGCLRLGGRLRGSRGGSFASGGSGLMVTIVKECPFEPNRVDTTHFGCHYMSELLVDKVAVDES